MRLTTRGRIVRALSLIIIAVALGMITAQWVFVK